MSDINIGIFPQTKHRNLNYTKGSNVQKCSELLPGTEAKAAVLEHAEITDNYLQMFTVPEGIFIFS